MRYLAMATDYDGTLACHGTVDGPTFAALERFRASGRKVILVTGRELEELRAVCPRMDVFDLVVAENGALLYRPQDHVETVLAGPPPTAFLDALASRGVAPVSVGRVIVATWEPHQSTVAEVIRELGLELQVILNKGSVMVLPSGVNKATGLLAALRQMGLSPHNVVAVCGRGAAVANALPALKAWADIVLSGAHGAGVVELIDGVLKDDLASVASPDAASGRPRPSPG